MIVLDSVTFVRSVRAAGPERKEILARMDAASRRGERFGIVAPSIGEIWRTLTREVDPDRVTGSAALAILRGWASGPGSIVLPGARFWAVLEELIDRLEPSSNAIFDLQILAICIEREVAEIWTLDQRFPEDSRVRVVNPLGQ